MFETVSTCERLLSSVKSHVDFKVMFLIETVHNDGR